MMGKLKPKPDRSLYLKPATLERLAVVLGIPSPLTPERRAELKKQAIARNKKKWRERHKKEINATMRRERSVAKAKRSVGRIPGWEFMQMLEDIEGAPPDKLKAMQSYLRKNEDRFRLSRLQRTRLLMRISARLRLCWKRALLA